MMTFKKTIIIAGLFIAVFTSGADSFIISPLLPEIAREFGSSISQTALGVTIYALCYAFGAPIFGPLGDRYNRRKLLLSGLSIFLIGTLLCAFANSLVAFYIFRAVAGIGAALFLPNVWAFIGGYFEGKQLNKVMGIVMSALSLSIAVGVPLGTFLSQLSDWHMAFFASAGIAVLAFIILLTILPSTKPSGATNKGYVANFITVAKTKNAIPALLITLFWMFGFYSIYTFLGSFVNEKFHLNLVAIGYIFVTYGLSNFVASFFGGNLMNKIGHKTSVIVNGIISILFIILMGFSENSLTLLIICLIVLAVAQGFGVTALTTYIVGIVPDNRSTVMAFNSSALYLGLTFGSAIGGLIFQSIGFNGLAVGSAIGLIIAVLITIKLKETKNA
ncbi:MFS transporter [Lactococcus termiticola]|uniref:Major facilitator superfamily transporter n=1 Tax=Lactococcus termiticola TaxID=2169526 RepID=A0A2R5HI33_9LACT|nr:MFS transporter [Lactococcus termiticola]GBG95900.1 major facilitator superfamily transporter [Lactococcus termiticola]